MINANKIKGRMREMGLVQKDIARYLRISPPTVSQKLSGARPMDLNEAKALAEMLKIQNDEFGLYFFA
jgi:transcriptional regulator with XRE-family HTH domain